MGNLRYLAIGLLSPVVGLIGLISPRYAQEILTCRLERTESATDDENELDVSSGLMRDQVRIGQDFRRAIDISMFPNLQRRS